MVYKVLASDVNPAQPSPNLLACNALSARLTALRNVDIMQFSNDSAFRASIGDMHRSQGNSSSTAGESSSLSHFSSSIEGKPSMDSVLRPQMVKQGTRKALLAMPGMLIWRACAVPRQLSLSSPWAEAG